MRVEFKGVRVEFKGSRVGFKGVRVEFKGVTLYRYSDQATLLPGDASLRDALALPTAY